MAVPSFEDLLQPTLDALHQLGGAPTIKAITSQVIHSLPLAPEDIVRLHGDTKQTELEYRLAWAYTYLKHYGLIDNPKRGTWTLTERGRATEQVDPKTVSAFVQDLIKRGKVDTETLIKEVDGPTSLNVANHPPQSQRATDLAHPSYLQADLDQLPVVAPDAAPFQPRAFELLEGIHTTPTKDYYQAHKAEFKQLIEEPFQRVFRQVAERLPAQIRAMMETENHIFARFLKNDWGKGGTWEFYWGAFYPKGGKRTEDAQLSMWIDRQRLEYGFYIGAYGSEQRLRFQRNCQEFGPVLLPYLLNALSETVASFGNHNNFQIAEDGSVEVETRYTWEEFLRNPNQVENDVSVIVPRQRLLTLSEGELVTRIADTYARLFPLVLLATDDVPLPAIGRYQGTLGSIEEATSVAPPKPCDRQGFLACTYLCDEQADDLYDLLLDKKQIILYGPPGTGKTYVAQELARWIAGLAQPPISRVEMIQFHPAYSYEDFIEGIRPESKQIGDGRFAVDYPPRPGVFRRFCKIAEENPNQAHVFIIDEINRGNIPRIFGELMLLLEYRDRDVPLPYSGERFRIPPNVYLIGTMNTADRSIALVDFALRRRFHFFQFGADPDLLERWLAEHPVPIPYLAKLYRRLSQEAIDDPAYAVGVSYFMDENLTEAKLARIWRRSIIPYLAEYHVEQRARIKNWEWESELMVGIRSGV